MTDKEKQTRREKIVDILTLAKSKGCDVYITPQGRDVAHGFMIFPNNTIMGVFEGNLLGWDFSIEYVPSRENGNGCMCQADSITKVTWDVIQKLKETGTARAKELGETFYETPDAWLEENGNDLERM